MSDAPAAPARKRTTVTRAYRVEDGSGRGAFYRATSTAQAKAFHVDQIVAREATIDEILSAGKSGIAIGGLPAPEADPNQGSLPVSTDDNFDRALQQQRDDGFPV